MAAGQAPSLVSSSTGTLLVGLGLAQGPLQRVVSGRGQLHGMGSQPRRCIVGPPVMGLALIYN